MTREDDSPEDSDPTEEDDVDLNEYPVGRSQDELVEAVSDSVEQGALADLLSKYEPEQFNDLVDNLGDKYKRSQKRKIKYHLGIITLSIALVFGLFAGLVYVVLTTGEYGGALIFFAGSLSGYFMRLASDLS